MDTRDIKLVLALAEHRHFARAAQATGISQPAFSARIQGLEQELGVRLVERGARFEHFTADGERIVQRFREIMAIMDGLRQEAAAASGSIAGYLRIAVIPTQLTVAGELAAALRAKHPDIQVSIQSRSSAAIHTALDRYEADVGISYGGDAPTARLRFDHLADETYVLAATKSVAGGADHMSWRQAATLPLAMLSPDMQNRRIIDEVFRGLNVSPRVVIESDTFAALVGAVRQGGAAAILPAAQAAFYAKDDGVHMLPLTEPMLTKPIGLYSLERDPDLPVIAAMRAVVMAR